MATEIVDSLAGLLTTKEVLARMESDLGIILHPSTIRSWISRPADPLPVAYRGRNGQAHRFDWLAVLAWYEAEIERTAQIGSQSDAAADSDINTLDWHSARTISARERAKQDILETRRLEGKYGEITAMEQAAEDWARQAVNALMSISSRVAPRLVAIADELEIDRILDAEIRAVCTQIEVAASAGLQSFTAAMAPAEDAGTQQATG